MRILIPMQEYYPDCPTGAGRLAFDEACYLGRCGHEVWVIAHDVLKNRPEFTQENGLNVLRYRTPRLNVCDPRRMGLHQRLATHLARRYIGKRVDVIHGHALLGYAGVLKLYQGKARTFYTVHSPAKLEMRAIARDANLPRRLLFEAKAFATHHIEKHCLTSTDCVIAVSAHTKNLLAQLHGTVIASKTEIIPGWVDTAKFFILPERDKVKTKLGWPTNVPVLFTLRRLVPRMGLDNLLQALRIIAKKNAPFHCIIGGDGPLRAKLSALASSLGLEKHVQFIGRVPDETLPLMYGAADAFVLPTAELECFGIIILEALACGCPVLATPVGAIPELIQQIEPQWLAKSASPEDLAILIEEFLVGQIPTHTPDKLRQLVCTKHTTEIVLPLLRKLIEQAKPCVLV